MCWQLQGHLAFFAMIDSRKVLPVIEGVGVKEFRIHPGKSFCTAPVGGRRCATTHGHQIARAVGHNRVV